VYGFVHFSKPWKHKSLFLRTLESFFQGSEKRKASVGAEGFSCGVSDPLIYPSALRCREAACLP
jgi:hypothetical protein